mmetsp:Transcript_3691/g.11515  ORF Transcript_3691/g.11515 Transcript_3691/m.11515 type:complete len:525 (-) Transcript_3691:261-1835(-)
MTSGSTPSARMASGRTSSTRREASSSPSGVAFSMAASSAFQPEVSGTYPAERSSAKASSTVCASPPCAHADTIESAVARSGTISSSRMLHTRLHAMKPFPPRHSLRSADRKVLYVTRSGSGSPCSPWRMRLRRSKAAGRWPRSRRHLACALQTNRASSSSSETAAASDTSKLSSTSSSPSASSLSAAALILPEGKMLSKMRVANAALSSSWRSNWPCTTTISPPEPSIASPRSIPHARSMPATVYVLCSTPRARMSSAALSAASGSPAATAAAIYAENTDWPTCSESQPRRSSYAPRARRHASASAAGSRLTSTSRPPTTRVRQRRRSVGRPCCRPRATAVSSDDTDAARVAPVPLLLSLCLRRAAFTPACPACCPLSSSLRMKGCSSSYRRAAHTASAVLAAALIRALSVRASGTSAPSSPLLPPAERSLCIWPQSVRTSFGRRALAAAAMSVLYVTASGGAPSPPCMRCNSVSASSSRPQRPHASASAFQSGVAAGSLTMPLAAACACSKTPLALSSCPARP